ncbi:D-alanyl-D-alanine carboxypeptidase/D-alanyl-D-alanine-endopeptidase [Nocardioides houyundeii]|uniref:D-alanyl-D-alanine carboxypeptidase/D-alanyl-D-alanine endopeptidase n=1 Tax=Nocardioides houyundeii TaxID=2045452 RepID=UPI0013B41D37|nr:D-alanyl-D-alanine carboxypeptidase/D-alanyl-D-alanine-endopeptidase [Nocardioides houyundeii]
MPRRDVGHTRARYRGPGRVAHWLPVLLVLALLSAGVAADRGDWGPRHLGWDAPSSPAVEPPAGLALPEPAPVKTVAPALVAPLDQGAVRRALRGPLRQDDLGGHVVALVADLAGSAPAYSRGSGTVVPASTTKLLTAVAALEALGPEATFSTRVVQGERPRDIVLVGGGDPYLASEPVADGGQPDQADVVTLARETAEALLAGDRPRRKVRLSYDTSLFSGPADNPHWQPDYVPDEIVAPITSLWVDGGRDEEGDGRVGDPARVAAERFASALADAGVRVAGAPSQVTASAAAPELAEVTSAPLDQVVQRLIEVSDNEAAEVVTRHVGLATTGEGSSAAGTAGVLSTLAALGVDVSADQVYDGSGLSRENRVRPETLLAAIRLAASPDHPELRAVVEGLPVAGFSGSLTWRFVDGDPAGPGRVRAKTGTLTGVHALAGLATDLDGTPMAFVLAADQVAAESTLDAREALDRAAASLAGCRCRAVG